MGQIKVEKNVGGIEGLCVVEPAVHGDARGYFMETYNEKDMKEAGIDIHFVQDNQSMSTKGVLRGLHFQKQYPQCKLVRAVRGTVFDVAVDLRSNSETWGLIDGKEPSYGFTGFIASLVGTVVLAVIISANRIKNSRLVRELFG